MFFFFKQKTAYEMRISDWSSDVCSSDLHDRAHFAISAYGIDRDFELGEHLRIHRIARFRPIERQMHDAAIARRQQGLEDEIAHVGPYRRATPDRKSTRLNSSH